VQLLAAGSKKVYLGQTELSTAEIGVLLRPWLPVWSALESADVFLSYRWGEHDSAMADGLFDTLSTQEMPDGRPMRVFQVGLLIEC
jgi:hypothetical protein